MVLGFDGSGGQVHIMDGGGPWLVDEDGNDVFDSINSPLGPDGSDHIVDEVDAEQSLENLFGDTGADVGGNIDDADQFVRDLLQSHPAAGTSDSLADIVNDAADVGGDDPWDPDNSPFTTGRFKLFAILFALGVGAIALGPALQGIGSTAQAIRG